MAERRMFSKTVIDSDAFIEMPLSSQALYFHLSMRADDDGFVNNPKRIRNDVGASEDDLKLLIAKRFVIAFESGVIVIKHWRIHNYIQSDRYKPTVYLKERSTLMVCENKAYTECIHPVSSVDTQVSIELEQAKDRGSDRDSDRIASTTTTTFSFQDAGAGAPVREEKESVGQREGIPPPSVTQVYAYMREELCEDVKANEAEKFVAWNEKFGWDCLPNWQGAARLWCARRAERRQ